MERIGERYVREELQIIPAQVKRVQIYQEVLCCKHCKDQYGEPVIVAAKPPGILIPHSMASASSVAWIITEKYLKHVPFYRIEQLLKQDGVRIHRGTMANWLITVTEKYLDPFYEYMKECLLKREILHADETRCQVLKEEGRKATQRSQIWVYLTGDDGLPPIGIYDYNPSRAQTVPDAFLKGFTGYLHTDCYQGYNAVEKRVTRCACWAHMRRYWYDAIPAELQKQVDKNKIEDKKKLGPAVTGFLYCDKLFQIEKKLKGLDYETRKAKRLETELPIIERYFAWVETLEPLNGSNLAKAVTFSKNNKDNLMNYLKDGRCSLSNNSAERQVKSYVMGRKSFLFHDTVAGAHSSCVLYSIVQTARANNLNVFQYLSTLLALMSGKEMEPADTSEYMPWSEWAQENFQIPG
jgi:transposase